MISRTFLSYNVASSSTLSGLNLLLSLFNPTMVFLQEITLTTEQLLAIVGGGYNGVSNVDPLEPRKPGTAVVWITQWSEKGV